MRNSDALTLGVNVAIEVRDAQTGELLERFEEHNLVTLAARNLIRDFLNNGTGITGISHLAVGTGTAEPNANDTVLGTERHRAAITKKTADSGKLTIQHYLGTSEANGYDLTEAGLLNAAAAGTLFARVKHTAISKTASLTVTYSWVININAG